MKPVRKCINKLKKEFREGTGGWDLSKYETDRIWNWITKNFVAKPTKSSVGKQSKCNDINDNCYYKGSCYFKTGKDGKRGKGDTTHCSPSTVNLRPTLKPIKKISEKTCFISGSFKGTDMEARQKLNQIIDRINLLSIQKEKK